MNVREQALAAHYAAEEAKGREADAEAKAVERTRIDAELRLRAVLADSPLREWFPTADWEVYALAGDDHWNGMTGYRARSRGVESNLVPLLGIVCEGRPGGTNPEYAGVPCFGIGPLGPNDSDVPDGGAPDRARVFYCHTRYDEGYTSWTGTEVTSREQLGQMIAGYEDAESQRIQTKYQQACRCFTNGSNPATTKGLRCVHAGKHAAMLAAADSAHCENDVAEAMRVWRLDRPTSRAPAEEVARTADDDRLPNGESWAEHCRRASEPEGRTTGLRRDSMG